MALATLYNVPSDDDELNIFSFANADQHTNIARGLIAQYNVFPPVYVLDPLPLRDMGTWLEQHQILHNIMNGVLGTNSNDLTAVDFSDQDQLTEWIWLHAQEHFAAADLLGLS